MRRTAGRVPWPRCVVSCDRATLGGTDSGLKRPWRLNIMHGMNIRDFDLNLLHVFEAVLATGHVGRAAERLGLSQPAVSHALTRLRAVLHDPLFVRAAGGVRPTPRAEQFGRFVGTALRTLDTALQEAEHFDPATTQRRFAVHMSDLATAQFLPPVMAALRQRAPSLRLEVQQLPADGIGPALDEGRLDLAFGYLPQLTGMHGAPLIDERYVVLLRADHPLLPQLTRREALDALHFILVQGDAEPAKALERLGLAPRIRLTIPHFAVVPPLLKATDLAVIVPEGPARRYAEAAGGLAVLTLDLGLPPLAIAIHWVWRMHNDPGHRWLRELALEVLAAPAGAA